MILKWHILGKSSEILTYPCRNPLEIHRYFWGENFRPPENSTFPGLSRHIFGANIFRICFILDYPSLSIESKLDILNGKRHILNQGYHFRISLDITGYHKDMSRISHGYVMWIWRISFGYVWITWARIAGAGLKVRLTVTAAVICLRQVQLVHPTFQSCLPTMLVTCLTCAPRALHRLPEVICLKQRLSLTE